MATRANPYNSFNFLVNLGGGGEDQVAGGFSEVSGLGTHVAYAEYRNGNDKENHPRKIPGLTTHPDVVLRRGLIGDLGLFAWIKSVSEGDHNPQLVSITMLDESRAPVVRFVLFSAFPTKWIGPALHAQAGEVAIEELVLTYEGLDVVSL
jgi:phage tail-like protein